jgi:hypothetical protein
LRNDTRDPLGVSVEVEMLGAYQAVPDPSVDVLFHISP